MKANAALLSGALIAFGIGVWWFGRTENEFQNRIPEAPNNVSEATARPATTQQPLRLTLPRTHDSHIVIPGRAVDVEAQLRSAALAGDADSSFKIYLKLAHCADPMAKGVSEQEKAIYRKAGVSTEALEGTVSRLRSDCKGAEQLVGQRGGWLEKAADQGLKDAQMLYAADPEAILGTSDINQIEPAMADAYAERSEGYMTALAQTGDVGAMLTLSQMYKDSQFTPRDDVRSAAYRLVAENVAPLQIGSQPREFTMRGLDARQQVEAEKLAREIKSRCCTK